MLGTLGVQTHRALVLANKLNQTNLILDPRVAVKKVLVGEELVLYPRDYVVSINRADDVGPLPCALEDVLFELVHDGVVLRVSDR